MKNYIINYEVAGSRLIDWVCFPADSISEAVKLFTEWEQNTCGIKWTYNERAIVSIKVIA